MILTARKSAKNLFTSGRVFRKSRDFPLLGMISRIASPKGFDLLEEILPDLMKQPVNLVILATGEAAIETNLRNMEKLYPDRLKLASRFDEQMAHLIEAEPTFS